jgi:C-terminal binding-module, SLH-like, of glucodextranase
VQLALGTLHLALIRCLLRAAAFIAVLVSLSVAQSASAASLYSGPGPRPGPDILYQKPATAPQLTNGPGWNASPILISGASSYRSGEFVYQDYLYDDHGANGGVRDQNDPRGANAGVAGDSFSAPNGTYTYPSNGAYAMNAADLVEFRVKPFSDHTAFRITLNTMKDPSLVGTTIAIGSSPGNVDIPMPDGANTSAPAAMFLTVHGTSAKLVNAGTNTPVPGGTPSVAVDANRRQIEVDVPHSLWDPTGQTVRLAAAVGLWDKANDKYLIPQQNSDATHPGGAGTLASPSAFFNVAFRHEPAVGPSDLSAVGDPAWWRDRAQGHALASGSISQFFANVDFTKLAAGTTDNSGVPATGAMDRILASHFETEQGVDYSQTCGSTESCPGEYRGRLQPYAIYVPKKPRPAAGYGMTLLLHSLGANYNQYLTSRNQSEFGERGPGSIVITPEGRGPDGWYYDAAGADTFEVWADVASRFKLDPAWTVITGYSMGGYGTFKFASQFPDLFAKGQPTVGPPALGIWVPPAAPVSGGERSNTNHMLPSVRNIPFMIWNAVQDELVPYAGAVAQAETFDQLGYRYVWDSFAPAEHLTLAFHDQFQPAADFLGTTKVNRNPAHVTYVVNPTMDFPKVGTVADHAYWLSGMKLRDASGDAPLGTIDVRSHGFGVGDPSPGPTQHAAGTLGPGTLGQLPFKRQSKAWGSTPHEAKANQLDITAKNIRSVTINAARARVTCNTKLVVKSDGPLTVRLTGCKGKHAFRGVNGRCSSSRPGASVSASSRLRRDSYRLGGSAFGCGGAKVKRVKVAISRAASGGRCRFVNDNGTLSSPRSCSRPIRLLAALHAHGTSASWRLADVASLTPGRYTVSATAIDSKGRASRASRRALRVR